MEHYVFQTELEAQGCIDYINATPWFPIVGLKQGQESPSSQTTTAWCESPVELTTDEWAVPRISESRLDYLEVPQANRDAFIAAFGLDIRDLTSLNFKTTEE